MLKTLFVLSTSLVFSSISFSSIGPLPALDSRSAEQSNNSPELLTEFDGVEETIRFLKTGKITVDLDGKGAKPSTFEVAPQCLARYVSTISRTDLVRATPGIFAYHVEVLVTYENAEKSRLGRPTATLRIRYREPGRLTDVLRTELQCPIQILP